MEYYSVVKGGCDTIDDVVNKAVKFGVPGKESDYRKKLYVKIVEIIKMYESKGFHVDGFNVKNLEGPFFEFRAKAGGTGLLIRIFFFRNNYESIVLTGSLIKPYKYDDKHNSSNTDNHYQQELSFCKQVKDDFLGEKKLIYQYLKL